MDLSLCRDNEFDTSFETMNGLSMLYGQSIPITEQSPGNQLDGGDLLNQLAMCDNMAQDGHSMLPGTNAPRQFPTNLHNGVAIRVDAAENWPMHPSPDKAVNNGSAC
jgi:hypothetical protein